MNLINRNLILKVFLVFSISIMVQINLLSYIYHNGSGSGYEGGSGGSSLDTGKVSSISNSIEGYIIEGAGYYLKANAGIQSLLNLVELQDMNGTDDAEMTRSVIAALDNITRARETFAKLIETAEATPYNPVVIEQLNNFAYDTFMTVNNLNPVIFNELASYLSRGDITGTFKHSYAGLCSLEKLLISIKEGLAMNQMPLLPVLWQLNETCAQTTLFGSYAARVFYEIN
jgi:hypothetical protein